MINAPEEKPRVTWALLRRVLGYSRPYTRLIVLMLIVTLITIGLSLLSPLILRDLIDRTLPQRDLQRLTGLVIAMLAIPLVTSGLNVWLRQINSRVGSVAGGTDCTAAWYTITTVACRPNGLQG